ncbi:DUF6531 domain-containing protein [Psychrobacter celer]|uniref:DUF6531 domain-containing protein n=2 Tax=Psychrobacter celer TaxID=306572 RepID=UPI003FD56F7E
MNNDHIDSASNADIDHIEPPKSGVTALGISKLMPTNNQASMLDIGMNIAGAIPNSKVSQTLGTAQSVANVYRAAQQGSALGVGMALAGAVPGSDFSEAMGKVSAASNAFSAIKSGNMLGAGMSLAGLDPNSPYAQVMGQVAQAKQMFDMGMSIFKPTINPADLIKYTKPLQQATETPSKAVSFKSRDGSYVRGNELRVEACPLASPEATVGEPVQALYGSKILAGGDDIDYRGTGYMPLVMSRIYNSQNPDTGWFGQGWVTQGYEQRLELDPQHNRIYLIDNTGRRVPFTYLAPDQSCYQHSEGITLYRKPLAHDKTHTTISARPIIAGAVSGTRIGDQEPLEFVIYQGDYNPKAHNPKAHDSETHSIDAFTGIAQHYSYVASRRHHGTKAVILLSSYADKYGHQNQLHYTRSPLEGSAHIPQYLTDDAGSCYEFEFTTINEQTRLAKLYQIEDMKGTSLTKTILAHYRYSDDADLIQVDIQGRTTRKFAYKNHLMTWQTQPDGQQVAYQYDRYDNPKAARVIEQAISTGRHYLFDYDTDTSGIESIGITTVTEQPGTDLERSRRYSYDDWYNMISLTDPNGHTTLYEYDV